MKNKIYAFNSSKEMLDFFALPVIQPQNHSMLHEGELEETDETTTDAMLQTNEILKAFNDIANAQRCEEKEQMQLISLHTHLTKCYIAYATYNVFYAGLKDVLNVLLKNDALDQAQQDYIRGLSEYTIIMETEYLTRMGKIEPILSLEYIEGIENSITKVQQNDPLLFKDELIYFMPDQFFPNLKFRFDFSQILSRLDVLKKTGPKQQEQLNNKHAKLLELFSDSVRFVAPEPQNYSIICTLLDMAHILRNLEFILEEYSSNLEKSTKKHDDEMLEAFFQKNAQKQLKKIIDESFPIDTLSIQLNKEILEKLKNYALNYLNRYNLADEKKAFLDELISLFNHLDSRYSDIEQQIDQIVEKDFLINAYENAENYLQTINGFRDLQAKWFNTFFKNYIDDKDAFDFDLFIKVKEMEKAPLENSKSGQSLIELCQTMGISSIQALFDLFTNPKAERQFKFYLLNQADRFLKIEQAIDKLMDSLLPSENIELEYLFSKIKESDAKTSKDLFVLKVQTVSLLEKVLNDLFSKISEIRIEDETIRVRLGIFESLLDVLQAKNIDLLVKLRSIYTLGSEDPNIPVERKYIYTLKDWKEIIETLPESLSETDYAKTVLENVLRDISK